jgi:hypothetical protein
MSFGPEAIEPAALEAGVARFNEFAVKGNDDDFNRGGSRL